MPLLLLKCPKCHNSMKYQSKDNYIMGKSKKCVYCGRSFNVRNNLIKEFKN